MADQYRGRDRFFGQNPETFQQAKDNLQLHQFYGDKDEHVFYAVQAETKDQTIDFSSFRRVLQNKQLEVAQK